MKVPLLDGCLTVEFETVLEIVGSIDAGASGTSSTATGNPVGYDTGTFASKISDSWNTTDGFKILGFNTCFTEVKTEGSLKAGTKGAQMSFTAYGKFGCGVEISFALNVFTVDDEGKVAGPSVKVAADIPPFPFDCASIDFGAGVKLNQVRVHPVVSVEIEPDYEKIAVKFGKEAGKRAIGEKVGETIVTTISVDGAIVAGFLLAGVSTIGAAILTVSEGDEIAETHGQCVALATKMSQGFAIGAAGGAPPSDKALMAGYTVGIRNYNNALDKVKADNPQASDDDIKAAIAKQVPGMLAGAQAQIVSLAKETVWVAYASSHQDGLLHSYEQDRWMAWSNIYDDDPRGNPLYAKFRNEHTLGTLGM